MSVESPVVFMVALLLIEVVVRIMDADGGVGRISG